jgi:hypothetical protein
MTPRQLDDAIETALDGYLDRVALEVANSWQARQVSAGVACDDATRDQKRDENRARYTRSLENMTRDQMVRQLAPPTVVVADTNWGDAESETTFVVAPDPRSGDLVLWKRYMPSGRMVPAGDDWADAQWMEIVPDD